MAIAELALIVLAFGAMAIVFGAQERRAERRILAWAEETLARLAAEARIVEAAASDDEDGEAAAHPPSELVGAA